jgi:hypothetical protein
MALNMSQSIAVFSRYFTVLPLIPAVFHPAEPIENHAIAIC